MMVGGERLEQVKNFTYLESTLVEMGSQRKKFVLGLEEPQVH